MMTRARLTQVEASSARKGKLGVSRTMARARRALRLEVTTRHRRKVASG